MEPYAARLEVDYPEQLDRVTSFFRLLWIIPIGVILALLAVDGLPIAIALMIVFRVRYPRWWFDFTLQLARFSARVGAYSIVYEIDESSRTVRVIYIDHRADVYRPR